MCCVVGSFVGFIVALECNGYQLPSNFPMFGNHSTVKKPVMLLPPQSELKPVSTSYKVFPYAYLPCSFNSAVLPCISHKCCNTVPLNSVLYASLFGKVTSGTYSVLQ